MGGRISKFLKNWEKITSNNEILEIVKGGKIDFVTQPRGSYTPVKVQQSKAEALAIQNLLKENVIEITNSPGVISSIFTKPKPSGDVRVILNLSELNKHVIYKHFKMQSIKQAILLSTPYCYYTKLDLSKAYDCVKIGKLFRHFLQFYSGNTKYQY